MRHEVGLRIVEGLSLTKGLSCLILVLWIKMGPYVVINELGHKTYVLDRG